jgi:phage terminase large subunit-like protein
MTAGRTILDLIDGPLAAWHGPSWATWRAIFAAMYALPMTAAEKRLFRGVAGGRKPPRRPVDTLEVVGGRGSGKDSAAADITTFEAITVDPKRLRPGERATILCLAVDTDQAKVAFRYISGYFEAVPMLADMVERITSDTIELSNGAEIVVGTSSFRSVRGRTYAAVVLDEVAFWRDESSAHPDSELDAAITPGLARWAGSKKILISSPYRRAGLLYQTWRDHFGKDDDSVLVVHGPTRAFNPTFPQATIDRELAKDRAKAGAEYLAEWRDDLVGLFDREALQACTDTGVYERPPVAGVDYVAFLDPASGRGNSSMVLAIAHSEGDRVVVDCVRECRPPFNAAERLVELCAVARSYGCVTIFKDRWGVEFSDELIRQAGLRCEVSPLPKNDLLLGLVPRVSSGLVRFIDSGRFVDQAAALERRVGITGRESLVTPDRTADDVVNAVAGAVHVASLAASPALIRPADYIGEAEADVPDSQIYCSFAVLVVDRDGRTGLSFFGAPYPNLGKPLTVLDFDAPAVTAGLFTTIAGRVDEFGERFRSTKPGKTVRAGVFVPAAFEGVALDAMQRAFAQRDVLGVQQYMFCLPYEEWMHDPSLLGNPAQMHYAASVFFTTGQVKFSASARDRRSVVPVDLGTPFGAQPDPLAMAILLGPLLRFWG